MITLTGFAEACYDQNSIDELEAALTGNPDVIDCKTWNITEDKWVSSIKQAIAELKKEL